MTQHALPPDDVRKLIYSHLGSELAYYGLDPEDFLQELWVALCRRQSGQHPYDPARASASRWLLLVARGVLWHYRDRTYRHRDRQVLASHPPPDDETPGGTPAHERIEQQSLVRELEQRLERRDRPVLPYVLAGHTAAEASVALRRTHREMLDAYQRIRGHAYKLLVH